MAHKKVGIVYHPDNILHARGYKAEIACSILITFFISVGWYLEGTTFILIGVSELYFLSFCGNFLRNISQLIEELDHINSRYSNIWSAAHMTLFSFNSSTKWSLIIALFILINHGVIYGFTIFSFWKTCHLQSFICIYLSVFIFSKIIYIDYSKLNFGLLLENMHGLDVGSGMAYNFYFGYLKLILPDTGTSCKGIKEKIADFEAINEVKFNVPKLFILVPSSMYCPPTLKDISEGWMEPCKSLEAKEINRAGVKDRCYMNSVYKMRNPNSRDKYTYIVVEGATPMKTFSEVIAHNIPNGKYYTLYRKIIGVQFFHTLCDILQNDKDCVDACHVVYYDDIDGTVNVAKILLDIINNYNHSS